MADADQIAGTPAAEPEWAGFSDDQLLETRICDLKLHIQGSEIESRIQTLAQELETRQILLKPSCYLGDEWFCPEGSAAIAVPFFLAHPRLRKLEERMMMEVEGGTEVWCLRLLRHEMGHVLNHAYGLENRKDWRKLFGSPSVEFSDYYPAKPYSKRFVRHLDDWYAQSHPEEDFAETFATWLTPGLDWRTQYRGWKALAKLEYVDQLLKQLATELVPAVSRARMSEASRLRSRLKSFYNRRRHLFAEDLPGFFDPDLRRLFAESGDDAATERATAFLRRTRKQILDAVSRWTGEPKYTINRLLRDLSDRCHALDLRLRQPADQTALAITAYLAAMASNYRLTGKFKRKP